MATPPTNESIDQHRSTPQSNLLPPLNKGTIQRAYYGVNVASNPLVQESIRAAFAEVANLIRDIQDRHINSSLRRFLLRLLSHSLFNIHVENPEFIPHKSCILAPNHLNDLDTILILGEILAHPFFYILGNGRRMFDRAWKRQLLKLAGGVIPLALLWKEELAVLEGAKAGRADLKKLATQIEQYIPVVNSYSAMRELDKLIHAILAQDNALLIFPAY